MKNEYKGVTAPDAEKQPEPRVHDFTCADGSPDSNCRRCGAYGPHTPSGENCPEGNKLN